MKKLFRSKMFVGLIVAVLFFAVATIYGCTSCSYTPDDNSSGAATENSDASGIENSVIDASDVSFGTESNEPSGTEDPSADVSEISTEDENSEVSEPDESSEDVSDNSSKPEPDEGSTPAEPSDAPSDDETSKPENDDTSKNEETSTENSDDVSEPDNSETSKEDSSADTSEEVSDAENDNGLTLTLYMDGGTSSSNPYILESSIVYIEGLASDKINGIKSVSSDSEHVLSIKMNDDGSFTARMSAKKENTTYKVTFTATSNAGETTSVTRYIRFDFYPAPSLYASVLEGKTADNPTYVAVTPGSSTISYTVEGTVAQIDGSTIKSITVNGVSATLKQTGATSWSWSAKLSGLSVNTVTKITIVAKNSIGKTSTIERYVYFDSPSLTEKRAFAIYSADDNSLTFYNRVLNTSVGEVYDGKTVTAIYTGFDVTSYSDYSETPWYAVRARVNMVKFEDPVVAPASTAYWFNSFTKCTNIDVTKLDIQHVTNMTNMFYMVGRYADEFNLTGIEKWDVSSVTNMEKMFYLVGESAVFSLDLSSWDVSNVTSYRDFNKRAEDKIIAPNFQ